ncbi:uncharacterized protein LOC127261103 [Andrographis paniculata]|uniref:uncharacterized protein LOC127261103 n=1 Tax=Andrographis paniculata TaxID=175694 RepID=UPI0021E8274A|nr:uncharacterized protein LOC127261103 [Andrographis paniculata]
MDGVAETGVLEWTSDTNWTVARGTLEASIAVESSDFPIPESDLQIAVPESPLVLKPRGPDFGPCEIYIQFEESFDISQIYVRSTARVYEIYYTRSPRSSNEYLCTVRCGVAERDGKVLQTATIGGVAGGGDCSQEEPIVESISNGGSSSNSEDDWVKIKVPEVGSGSLSDKINSGQAEKIQDLYEATAQISDAEHCTSLTIRLLSLQDRGAVYIDEVYVFVALAESSDSGNEAPFTGSSTQNSLMAMFVPTLLQLSKSGVNRVRDECASDEVVKDDKTETRSETTDQIDDGLQKNQAELQNAESERLDDKNTSESAETPESTVENKCVEPVNSLPRNLENTLEELVSRVSRVEDMFLRFEEKLLRPIESIETRLQRVELQLEKLAQSSLGSSTTHCTRICAPAFSCSESNSSSLYNDQSDYPTRAPSDIEKKDLSCDSIPDLPPSHDAKLQPSLVVSAPKFTYDEDEEDNSVAPLEDSPRIKLEPKKAVSVDDALAAALNGFLSSAMNHPPDVQTTSGDCEVIEGQEFLVAENIGSKESLQYTRVLSITAPDFSADETGNDDDLNDAQSSLNIVFELKNDEKGHNLEASSHGIESSNVSIDVSMVDPSSEANTSDSSSDDPKSDLAKDSVKSNISVQIDDETNPGTPRDSTNTSEVLEGNASTEQECIKDHTFESSSSLLDFNFPILDVKFTPVTSSNPDSLLEALLYGTVESSAEVSLTHDSVDSNGGCADGVDETADSLPVSPLLVDVDIAGGGYENLESEGESSGGSLPNCHPVIDEKPCLLLP